jgi:hypothetical protein
MSRTFRESLEEYRGVKRCVNYYVGWDSILTGSGRHTLFNPTRLQGSARFVTNIRIGGSFE